MSLLVQAKVKRGESFVLDIQADFPDKKVSALFGKSGSGKSTILRLLAGLERNKNVVVSFNEVIWQDEETFTPPHKRHIGFVFQNRNLFPHINVSENLDYAEDRRQPGRGLSRQDLLDILDLSDLLKKSPKQLSGGESQRVAIARALLSNPNLIVMDEPLGSLDQSAKDKILPYLQRLHKSLELPIIYVSHDINEVLYLADTVFEISNGKLLDQRSVFDFSISSTQISQRDAVAIISCEVNSENKTYSLTELKFEHSVLFLSAPKLAKGKSVRVKIPARDVSLSRQRNESSIINVIETYIEDIIDQEKGASAIVKLKCGQQHLFSLITRKSLHDLRFQKGERVFAQIKGVALMIKHE